ncbi:predicted protein [Streptomyces lividans TK24]|uniref:Uncharacterized protein n=1 Tax=Streptomyces lividans 1326 TaxID=1200984 RepID=A0A7U9DNM1_STRLI|nr:predicted protein [Streptomyces lividans TK24]EOY44857.1 hypothetical protein SLI_0138 [Streptomyces lividans 1326]
MADQGRLGELITEVRVSRVHLSSRRPPCMQPLPRPMSAPFPSPPARGGLS